MDSVIYAITFKGEAIEGFELNEVKTRLAKLLNADSNLLENLFSGKNIVIKRTASKDEAIKYGNTLRKAGADIKVKVSRQTQSDAATETAPQPALQLTANEGDIFDVAPESPRPKIDLSAYSVHEQDGSTLMPEKVYERAHMDLNAFHLAEDKDQPLSPPAPPSPEVVSPNFGLDEPGAFLDTVKEDVEPLHPDTSHLSLKPE